MSHRAALVAMVVAAFAGALSSAGPSDAAPAEAGAPSSRTVSARRAHLVEGQEVVADTRTVTVEVSATTDLRSDQRIEVSWTGAHPTGGIYADRNASDARNEEYPVVVMQCRGTDDPSAPVASRIDPTTCWTATAPERYQASFSTLFPPWRVDRLAPPAERTATVGAPAPRPARCISTAPAERWVPFVAASGTVYPVGSLGCAGMAPEAANVGGLSVPSNTTYGVTGLDGRGSVDFDIWTSENNASLGCSQTVACSLVVIPIVGISCDVDAPGLPVADRPAPEVVLDVEDRCTAIGSYQPGQIRSPGLIADDAVSGAYWWSASNWANRVAFPLTFAPPANACDILAGDRPAIDIYGSELLIEAAVQWAPHFCLDPDLVRFKHVQTGEPEARNLLISGGISAAFTSAAPDDGFERPIVSAPVALTGFSISFAIDDEDGNPLRTLRLTPRLLAKLLTESYPALLALQQEYEALQDNPLNITLDPEFIALNPGVEDGIGASESASALLALSSDSDVIAALTAYIDADPEARVWLDGEPDPWGMVVNPNYEGMDLPVESWPLLDTFQPPQLYAGLSNLCLHENPVAFLPLVSAPMARLRAIAHRLQFALATPQVVCQLLAEGIVDGARLVAIGRQTVGHRFMIAVTSLADARRFGLDAASLQTQVNDEATTAEADDVSAANRVFVAPTDASLRAAALRLEADETTGTWPVPYETLRTEPGGALAYPGTMVVYAQVPTEGLAEHESSALAAFMRFVATDGQTPGAGNGQLPTGYLPLTSENGLGALADYALAAADAVAAQTGEVPSVVAVVDPAASPTGSGGGSPGPSASGGNGGVVRPSSASSGFLDPASGDVVAAPNGVAPPSIGADAVAGSTVAAVSSVGAAFVPLLGVAAALGIAGAVLSAVLGRRRTGRS